MTRLPPTTLGVATNGGFVGGSLGKRYLRNVDSSREEIKGLGRFGLRRTGHWIPVKN